MKAELSKLGYDKQKTNTILYKVLRAIGFRPKYGPYMTGWEAFGFSFALAAITFPLALVIADCMSFLNFNRKLLIVTDLVCGLATALVFAGVMARFTVKFKKDQQLTDWDDL